MLVLPPFATIFAANCNPISNVRRSNLQFDPLYSSQRINSAWEIFSITAELEPITLLFALGGKGKPNQAALRSFLNEYDRELKRMKDLTRRGGTHGSRRWDELSLKKLVESAKGACAAAVDGRGCKFSCKTLLIGQEWEEGSAYATALGNDDECKVPTYKQAMLYLTKNRGELKRGQLEVVGSGWVGHDETLPDYADVLGSMTLGRTSMRKELGFAPEIAWQVDSFGHSSTSSRLFREMGFRATLYNRLSWDIKKRMLGYRATLFNWVTKEGMAVEADIHGNQGIHNGDKGERARRGTNKVINTPFSLFCSFAFDASTRPLQLSTDDRL